MPLQATSGAASYDAFGGGVPVEPVYIEQIFSTYLYTGNDSTQTINNGIDLAGKGGLTWIKVRDYADSHRLFDTSRGVGNYIVSNSTSAQLNNVDSLTAFNSTGFNLGNFAGTNGTAFGSKYVSWTFRKQPKFFDVVTYTGNGSTQTISHNLDSVPACIIVKNTSDTSNWAVYHKGYSVYGGTGDIIQQLNLTNAASFSTAFNNTMPTSTNFQVGLASGTNGTNVNGNTYVAYLFASNAGGFGLTGTDNVITCDYYTGNGSATGPIINLGYEPQWLMIKSVSDGNWQIIDNIRGMPVGSADAVLKANTADAESSIDYVSPTATGFQLTSSSVQVNGTSVPYIYIAIRRGPMKVPTDATKVFTPITRTGTGATATVTGTGFPIDLLFSQGRSAGFGNVAWDRLRGVSPYLGTFNTNNEANSANSILSYDMDGITVGADTGSFQVNQSTKNYIYWMMRRAPSFFDEVCYTGDGTAGQNIVHNLGVAPELIIVKGRNSTLYWAVQVPALGSGNGLALNLTNALFANGALWNSTAPTSSVFTVGTSTVTGNSGSTYVAYLFATCAGVSKVGSYTGTGATQTINCGFGASGSRFVLIKRTDSTGDWYVWDSARGMVSGTDPKLALNSTAAESNANWVYTTSGGFQIVTSDASVNASGGSYIYFSVS